MTAVSANALTFMALGDPGLALAEPLSAQQSF